MNEDDDEEEDDEEDEEDMTLFKGGKHDGDAAETKQKPSKKAPSASKDKYVYDFSLFSLFLCLGGSYFGS